MASLTKRPGNKNKPWAVQWWDSAGKRRDLAFRTNREAKDFKIKLEHDQREGTFVDPRLGARRRGAGPVPPGTAGSPGTYRDRRTGSVLAAGSLAKLLTAKRTAAQPTAEDHGNTPAPPSPA